MASLLNSTNIPTKRGYATADEIYSTADVIRIHEAAIIPARRFNSATNIRNFGTRFLSDVYKGEGGVYFVASNKRPAYKSVVAGERQYQVYQFNPETGAIWEPSAKDFEDKLLGYTTPKEAKERAKAFAANKVPRHSNEE